MKELYFKESLDKILAGLDKATRAVGGTLGPCGGNAFINDDYTPKVTNDGATIARNIEFKDKLENIGAYIIKNVAGQTNDVVGDGTTTTAVLTHAIIHECLNRPENPQEVMRSLKEAGKKAVALLKAKSVKLKKEDYGSVARVSTENEELARIITEIISKLGSDAVVNIEDSRKFETEYEIVDGYTAESGFLSPYFANQGAKAVLTDVPVFVSQKRISNLQDIAPLFEQFQKNFITSCVFVCDEIEDSILGYIVVTKLKGAFNSIVVKASSDELKDIAGATGATIVSDASGVTFQNITLQQLGRAKRVIVDAHKSIFLGDSIASKLYSKGLESEANREENKYIKERTMKRVAKLRGGIATLKVYAATDFEREYLKLKAEDGVKALQAAIEEGIVEGGGLALWRISDKIGSLAIGEQILKKALKAPFRNVVENAGKDYSEIAGIILNSDLNKIPVGYNAKNGFFVDMLQEGIIDPTKVERVALENAVSAASTFITSFAYITNEEKS